MVGRKDRTGRRQVEFSKKANNLRKKTLHLSQVAVKVTIGKVCGRFFAQFALRVTTCRLLIALFDADPKWMLCAGFGPQQLEWEYR
jgi:hypothetical protein